MSRRLMESDLAGDRPRMHVHFANPQPHPAKALQEISPVVAYLAYDLCLGLG